MILTVVVFLAILSILVVVHEFGHFIVGKINGIKIEEFALGLPFTKPLYSKTLKDGMKLSFYPILFGGFVKLLGEEKDEKVKNSFSQKTVWQRISVVVAGVTMNLFLAIAAFYLFLSLSGFKVLVPRLADYDFSSPNKGAVIVTDSMPNSPAQAAGLKNSDVILNFADVPTFQKFVKSKAGTPITLEVSNLSLKDKRVVTLTPRVNPPKGEGALGIGVAGGVAITYETSEQKLLSGLNYTKDMFAYNISVIRHLASQSAKDKDIAPLTENVSGPFGIAEAVSQILSIGGLEAFINLINLLGILSLSLAFMNILPFPALDGGRFAFLLVEAVTGKRLPSKIENFINQAGMAFLLILIFLISFNDIGKIVVR